MFSIIIPFYNSHSTLRRTLDSLVKQTEKDFEVLLCDDRSDVPPFEILKDYENLLNIHYFKVVEGEPHGCCSPRNLGIRQAKGGWVIFLDADDILEERCIEISQKHVNDEIDVLYGKYFTKIKEEEPYIDDDDHLIHGKVFSLNFLKNNNLFFNTYFKKYEDIEFCENILNLVKASKCNKKNIDDILSWHLLDFNGVTTENIKWDDVVKYTIQYKCSCINFLLEHNIDDFKEIKQGIFYVYFVYCLINDYNNIKNYGDINFISINNTIKKILSHYSYTLEEFKEKLFLHSLSFSQIRNNVENTIDGGFYRYPFIEKITLNDFIDKAMGIRPKYSIVIPCYNCKKTIVNTLLSIYKQDNPYIEVIISDDKSTDNFYDCIIPFKNILNIKYIKTNPESKKGPSSARNTGIRNSNGEWIVFLDSDDMLADNAINEIEKYDNSGSPLIWGGFLHGNGDVYFQSQIALHGKVFKRTYIEENCIWFNENLYTEEDFNFVTKFLLDMEDKGVNPNMCDAVLYIHTINKESMTHVLNFYFERQFKNFVEGYTEPYFNAIKKYNNNTILKNESFNQIFYQLIIASYRYLYFLSIEDERPQDVPSLEDNFSALQNVYKKYCTLFGVEKKYFLERIEKNENDEIGVLRRITKGELGVNILNNNKDLKYIFNII